MSIQNDALSVALKEFQVLRGELEQLALDHERSPATQIIDQYFMSLNLLSETAAMLGLTGMQMALDKQAENLIMIDPEQPLSHQLPNFQQWLNIATEHLTNPDAQQPCIDWVNLLETDSWPNPLEVRESRELVNAFAKEITYEEDISADNSKSINYSDLTNQISNDADDEVIEAFLIDTPTQLENLYDEVSQIHFASINADSLHKLQAAQRLSHTIKGSANLVGLTALAAVAHELEDFFEALTEFCQTNKDQEWSFDESHSDAIGEALDCMMTLLEDAQNDQTVTVDFIAILKTLSTWREWQTSEQRQKRPEEKHDQELNNKNSDSSTSKPTTCNNEDQQAWVRLVEEMSINLTQSQELFKQIANNLNELKNQDLIIQEHRFELENAVDSRSMAQITPVGLSDDFDSLEMDRYDEIHRTTHQFIESVSDNREMVQSLQQKIYYFDGLIRQQKRQTEQFQFQVMQTTQQPFSAISSRLQRCVRQAARFTDKQAVLLIAGDDLQADRHIVQALADPLMHLLRNCVDHGIESERADKPTQGRIEVHYRLTQRQLEVKVIDDGHGIDAEKLLSTAKEKRVMLSEQHIANPLQLIFISGLSTRSEATQISGRGIGMDAVATQIQQLNGQITVDSELKEGTRFSIRIPLNQVTRHMIICRIGNEKFAIDSAHLQQIIPPDEARCERKGEHWIVHWQDDWIQIESIHPALLQAQPSQQAGTITHPLLIIDYHQKPIAIGVDALLNSYELVLKPFGDVVAAIPGFSGLTQTGDGTLVPVLNLSELLSMTVATGAVRSTEPTVNTTIPTVLVVDDSLSVRNALRMLLHDTGYTVETATDGIEALEKIKRRPPSILLLDMEMPRLNGLELTKMLRNQAPTKNLPILMITSRSAEKHRQQAEAAGVNAYLTKPFNENDVIDTVNQWMSIRTPKEVTYS